MIRLRPLGDPKSVVISPPRMTEPGDRVKCKRKCCKSGPRCKRCPVVWKQLSKQGYAERTDSRHYRLSVELRKKQLKKARA